VVRLEQTEGLKDDEIPIRYRDHALFVAFAPAEAPEIALAVVVEHAGKGGGAIAAPIAQKVLAAYFQKHSVKPESELTANVGVGSSPEVVAQREVDQE
jgi:penicillin-binding protein 2